MKNHYSFVCILLSFTLILLNTSNFNREELEILKLEEEILLQEQLEELENVTTDEEYYEWSENHYREDMIGEEK